MRILLLTLISLLWLPLSGQNSGIEGSLATHSTGRRAELIPFDSPEAASAGVVDSLSTYHRALTIETSQQGATSYFGYLNSWAGRQIKLIVESAPKSYYLYINGERVAYASSGVSPTEFNITRVVEQGRNTIEFKYHPFQGAERIEGWSPDTLSIARAYIIAQPTLHINDLFERTTLSQGKEASTTIGISLQSTALGLQQAHIFYELLNPKGEVVTQGTRNVEVQMRGADTITLSTLIPHSMLWSAESPTLYRLNIRNQRGGRKMEHLCIELGLRSVEWRSGDGLYINGNKVDIKAKRVAASTSIEQLEALKEQGFNTFIIGAGRYHAQIYSWADHNGAYLIPTAAVNSRHGGDNIEVGGNPTNDPAWREEYVSRADNIFHATQLHPSVVGFAIAEQSLNGDNLYQSYLHLKAKGDARPVIYLDGGGEWNNDNFNLSWE